MEVIIKNTFKDIFEELTKDGKVKVINVEDSSVIFNEIDSDLMKYKLILSQKEKDSEIEASNIVLTF